MPYVARDPSGKIVRASSHNFMGAEGLPHGHPDLVAFLESSGQDPQRVEQALNDLRKTDNEMARAIEDVIMVLLKKNLLKMTDLPKPVQDRMNLRVKLRMMIEEIYHQASDAKPG